MSLTQVWTCYSTINSFQNHFSYLIEIFNDQKLIQNSKISCTLDLKVSKSHLH
jgi:hypothetical protein